MKKSTTIFLRNRMSQGIALCTLLAAIVGISSCKKNSDLKNTTLSTTMSDISLARSAVGDVVGKVTVGYQGWFAAAGDGSPLNSWRHWASSLPSPGNQSFELWPNVTEYATTFATGYANLGNGNPANLFASYPNNTVDTHFKWMQQYGIDCAAVQRFGSELSNTTLKSQRDGIATKVKNAAQTFGRKFYIMYDISSWTNFQTEIKTDWTNTIVGSLALTSSGAYAQQNGKPVVCIWGIGVSGRPGNVTSWTDIINWFKGQGCYVIIGVGQNWRTQTTDLPAFNAANMISPWTVGSYKGVAGADGYVSNLTGDVAYTDAHNQDYQPVVFPGFAWSNWNGGAQNDFPRVHGDFLWEQFANIRNNAIPSAYVAMFDEFDEGTAITKAAENSSQKPTNQYFLTLDADGVACSTDFYLRLTGDGTKMVKGITPLVWAHPTPHMNYLDHADATTGWASSNTLTLNTTDKKEGTGSLQSVGSGIDEFKKTFTAFNSGASASTGSIQFWYYVSDVTKFSAGDQIEIGSGGGPDVNEYNWSMGTVVNGWNIITKTFATAGVTGGTPNLNAINWFRIYHTKTASITTKVDAIQIMP